MDKEIRRERGENLEGKLFVVGLAFFFSFVLFSSFVLATPTGPTAINVTSNTTKAATSGQIVNISGGYVAKLNLTATTQNPHWKAFVGWVNGKFTLDDSAGSTIYDWTLSTVNGEVYATRTSSTPAWGSIACATAANITSEESTLVHTNPDDNISATFSGTNSNPFVTAGTTISAASCSSTNTYVNNVSQSSTFEEVILSDATNLVYASVLEQDSQGYDGNDYDFQMIVPENGSATWTGATAYYVYLELS
jgi:hypothetical protein